MLLRVLLGVLVVLTGSPILTVLAQEEEDSDTGSIVPSVPNNPISNIFLAPNSTSTLNSNDNGNDDNDDNDDIDDNVDNVDNIDYEEEQEDVVFSYPSLLKFEVSRVCQGHAIREIPVDGETRAFAVPQLLDTTSSTTGSTISSESWDWLTHWLVSLSQAQQLLHVCEDPYTSYGNHDYSYFDSSGGSDQYVVQTFFGFQRTGQVVEILVCPLMDDYGKGVQLEVESIVVFQIDGGDEFCSDPDYFWWRCVSLNYSSQATHYLDAATSQDNCMSLQVDTTATTTAQDASFVVVISSQAIIVSHFATTTTDTTTTGVGNDGDDGDDPISSGNTIPTSPTSYSFTLTLSDLLQECSTAVELATDGSVTALGFYGGGNHVTTDDSEVVTKSSPSRWAYFSGNGETIVISACHPSITTATQSHRYTYNFVSVYRGSCEDGHHLKPIIEADDDYYTDNGYYHDYDSSQEFEGDSSEDQYPCTMKAFVSTQVGVIYYIKMREDEHIYGISVHNATSMCTTDSADDDSDVALKQLGAIDQPLSEIVLEWQETDIYRRPTVCQGDGANGLLMGPMKLFSFNTSSSTAKDNTINNGDSYGEYSSVNLVACSTDPKLAVQLNIYAGSCNNGNLTCLFRYGQAGDNCVSLSLEGAQYGTLLYHASVALIDKTGTISPQIGQPGKIQVGLYRKGLQQTMGEDCQQAKPIQLNARPQTEFFVNSDKNFTTPPVVFARECYCFAPNYAGQGYCGTIFDSGMVNWYSFQGTGKDVVLFVRGKSVGLVWVLHGFCPGASITTNGEDSGPGGQCNTFSGNFQTPISTIAGRTYTVAVITTSTLKDPTFSANFTIGVYDANNDCSPSAFSSSKVLSVGQEVEIKKAIGVWTVVGGSDCSYPELGLTTYVPINIPRDGENSLIVKSEWTWPGSATIQAAYSCPKESWTSGYHSVEIFVYGSQIEPGDTSCLIIQQPYDEITSDWDNMQLEAFTVSFEQHGASDSTDNRLPTWALALIIAIACAVVVAAAGACYLKLRKRRKAAAVVANGSLVGDDTTIEFTDDNFGGEPVTATAKRPLPDSSIGLVLCRKDGGVVIKKICDDSIFEGTDLRAGMRIVQVNDNDCWDSGVTTEEVAALLQSTCDKITVVACAPNMVC